MKFLNVFWIGITVISLSAFVPEVQAKENKTTTTYNKAETKEIVRSRRRVRRISYRIPAQARANNRSRIITARGSATRRPGNSSEDFQTILAPNHVANTISSHPTFAVHFPEAQGNYVVTLEEKGSKFNNTIWQQNLKVDKPGIQTIKIPKNIAGLQTGKDYRFSVKRVLNPSDRSQDVVAQVWLQKVEISPEVAAKIAKITDPSERAIVLANEAIWFDSIASLVEQNDPVARELLANLLEQVGLQEAQKVATAN